MREYTCWQHLFGLIMLEGPNTLQYCSMTPTYYPGRSLRIPHDPGISSDLHTCIHLRRHQNRYNTSFLSQLLVPDSAVSCHHVIIPYKALFANTYKTVPCLSYSSGPLPWGPTFASHTAVSKGMTVKAQLRTGAFLSGSWLCPLSGYIILTVTTTYRKDGMQFFKYVV